MPRGLAINVGANTSLPGFRGPVRPSGRFVYVPIPEREPTRDDATVPRYADLELPIDLPRSIESTAVHLDPEFPEYPFGQRYTYGDEHGVKAGPLTDLDRGDEVYFYATLESIGASRPPWMPPMWGAYLIGRFTLAIDPVVTDELGELPADVRRAFANNAHVKRREFDARVLVLGSSTGSGLLERAVPMSAPTGGSDPNEIVTELSSDSGRGPWWRRPLHYDEDANEALRMRIQEVVEDRRREYP